MTVMATGLLLWMRDGKFIQGDVSAAIIADHVLRQSRDKRKIIAVTIAFSNLIKDVAENLGAEVISRRSGNHISPRQNSCAARRSAWKNTALCFLNGAGKVRCSPA